MVLWLGVTSALAGLTLLATTGGWVTAFIGGIAFGAGTNAFAFEVIR